MAAPPQTVAVTTVQPFVGGLEERYRKTVMGLAITEIILGSVSILCGIIIALMVNRAIIGEGIWCGIWVLIGLGFLVLISLCTMLVVQTSNTQNVGPGLTRTDDDHYLCIYSVLNVNCHMGFAIVAAIFSGVLFAIAIPAALLFVSAQLGSFAAMYAIMSIASVIAFIVLIVSASYCCCTSNGCCQSNTQTATQGQVVYVSTGNQPAPVGAAAPGYQPLAQSKQQEAYQAEQGMVGNHPPIYQP